MSLPTYLPHVVYATALTSISLHLLSQRRGAEERRLQLEARIGVLEMIRNRLRAGEDIGDEEIARLRRMAMEGDKRASEKKNDSGVEGADRKDGVGWADVMFGRKIDENVQSGRDIAESIQLKKEWDDANQR